MRAYASADYTRLEKIKENCHVDRVGPFSGRRRGRLYDNQNNGFGPLYHLPITLTAHPGGVSSDPAACCRLHDSDRAGACRHSLGFNLLTSFNDFGLAEPITRALTEAKYVTPTPIQSDAIPVVLAGRDIMGIAQTGTGKTAAFALPILNRLAANRKPLEKKSPRILVLSPTRELSGQILDSFRTYGRYMRLQTALVIGGVPMGRQVRDLMNGLDVLVATPGRLIDLMRSNGVRLNQVEVLVLDEADRMLDMGFIHDIRNIVSKLPKERQTLFFSATMPREIADLAAHMLKDPVRVAVTPVASTAERIAQSIILVDRAAKPTLLIETLRAEAMGQTLVFTRTKHGADKVVRSLNHAGISAEAIHGNKSQNQRERVLAGFRNGKIRTLVATDIAARGIDVTGISHVINYDMPNVPESYVHRIGRTARAGAEGIAISFVDHEEMAYLRGIEKLIQMKLDVTDKRTAPHAAAAPAKHHRPHKNGGRNGNGRNNGRNANGRSGQQPRQNGERPHGQQARNGDAGKQNQPRRNEHHRGDQHRGDQHRNENRHVPAAAQGAPAEIAGVAFMQQREPRRPHRGGDANRNAR
ncbi:MAG: ATP-dependent helicase RhlE [Hyphomicrobiales bacterium]|jgi:ATP-dependent RNA helicase RhlE